MDLDLAKSAALLASKCAGVYIAAPIDNELELDRSTLDWLQNELLSQGIEYDDKTDAIERVSLNYLPFDLSPVLKKYRTESEKRFDLRDSSGRDALNYLQIAKDLAPMLSRIPFEKLPLPSAEVGAQVDSAVLYVFAVLIKHNLLGKTAMKMLSDKELEISEANRKNISIPDSIQRVWKTAQKLRSWLVQKFQAELSAKQAEITRKMQEEEEKAEGGKTSAREMRRKIRRARGAPTQAPQSKPSAPKERQPENNAEEKKEEPSAPSDPNKTKKPKPKEKKEKESEENADPEAKLLKKN